MRFTTSGSPLLSQFQRRQREQGKYKGCDPKTHNDLGLRPAKQLEVMM
jgi:hypothetical protein